MSYYIHNTDSSGFGFSGSEKEIMGFMDHVANELSERRIKACASEEALVATSPTSYVAEMERLRDAVLSAKEFEEKKKALRPLLDKADYPFDISIGYGEVSIEYDLGGHDYWRDEDEAEEFLSAIAPYLKKGSWIGLVGEDLSIWSYVFDGKGGFETVGGSINWTGRPYADEGGDAR